jgi:site-specific DNA recombinase
LSGISAIGYVRVSSQEQVVEGNSLAAQKARIEAWADVADACLVEVIEDAGISGSRPLVERPGGARIVALLDQRNPGIDTVVVTRLDRLGRNASEALSYLHRFSTGKIGLVSITDRIDLSTPAGRAMASMAAVFAELERELIGQRTSEALGRLQVEGRAYGATPYGFRRDGDFLVVEEDQHRVITQILELRYSRCSYREIAAWLNGESIPAKRGGIWSAMSVRSVCLTAARRDELAA